MARRTEDTPAEATEPPTLEELLGTDDPYERVRARAVEGFEYTTTRVAALSAGATVLDKPATDQFGLPHPTKTVLDLRAETTPTDAEAEGQPGITPEEN